MKLPYLPDGRTIKYVSPENKFMAAAKAMADFKSLDAMHPTGAVIVKNGLIIGRGANGSTWHEMHGCERKRKNTPTGTGYELCEGCHPKNHAEQKALLDALKNVQSLIDTDLYLWGHWWCCHRCWERIIETGIRDVFLTENADKMFKK